MFEQFTKRLDDMSGVKSVYFKNLRTGEIYAYDADAALNAASVIKLAVMAEAFRAAFAGELDMNERMPITKEDILPSCGVLNVLLGVPDMTIWNLISLMITVSDNTAANLLIKRLGMDSINKNLRALGLERTTLRRLLFDAKAAEQGIQNTVTMREIGMLLERIARFTDGVMDLQMHGMLANQKLNGKIPFFLKGRFLIAHKTGEDDGISHDVAILNDRQTGEPLCVMCFGSEHVCVPDFERLMQDFALEMAETL